MQPRIPLAFFYCNGTCSTGLHSAWCPRGPFVLFLQSKIPAGWPQHALVPVFSLVVVVCSFLFSFVYLFRFCFPPVAGFCTSLIKLCKFPLNERMNLVYLTLFLFVCLFFVFHKWTCCGYTLLIIQIINAGVEQNWTQYWPLGYFTCY